MGLRKPSLLQRPFDLLICVFYGIQVPMAMLLDCQAVLPKAWFPEQALALNDWYINKHHDPLVSGKPGWFVGCCYFELFVQVPFYIIAVSGYALGKDWILLPNLVFSSASAALMIPILSELLLSPLAFDRMALLLIYAPFAVVPVLIAANTYSRLARMQQQAVQHPKHL